MADQLNIEVSDTMNDEDINTPGTITKGQLAQLSLAFNNCQAMAEQVQSLATEIARLRLLSDTSATTSRIEVKGQG